MVALMQKFIYLGTIDVIGQIGRIRVNVVVFGQSCCIWEKWLYSGKICCNIAKWLFGQSGCFRA